MGHPCGTPPRASSVNCRGSRIGQFTVLMVFACNDLVAAQRSPLQFPTPAIHFSGFDEEVEARALAARILASLDPFTLARLAARLGPETPAALSDIPPDVLLELFGTVDLTEFHQDILELFIHQSRIPDETNGQSSPDGLVVGQGWRESGFLFRFGVQYVGDITERVAVISTLDRDLVDGVDRVAFGVRLGVRF